MATKNIEIKCNAEYLEAYKKFGLNIISIEFESGTPFSNATDISEIKGLSPLCSPWKAEVIKDVIAWTNKQITGKVAPSSWRTKTVSRTDFKKSFDDLVSGLDLQFETGVGTAPAFDPRFLISRAATSSSAPISVKRTDRTWGMTLGQVAILPAPIPQLLNLSQIVELDSIIKDTDVLKMAPKLEFKRVLLLDGDATKFDVVLAPDTNGPQETAAGSGVYSWPYNVSITLSPPGLGEAPQSPPPAQPDVAVKLFVNAVRTQAPAQGTFLNLETLYVNNPGSSVLNSNWLAVLEDKMIGAFDLSRRIHDHVRLVNPADPTQLSIFKKAFLASLRDTCGLGAQILPNKEIAWVVILKKLTPAEAPTPAFLALPSYTAFLDKVKTAAAAAFPSITEWAAFLKEVLSAELGDVKILSNPTAIDPPLTGPVLPENNTFLKTLLDDFGQVTSEISKPPILARIFCAQWKKIGEKSADADVKNWANKLSALDQKKLAETFDLGRFFARENIAVLWKSLILSGLVADDGSSLVLNRLKAFYSEILRLRFQQPALPLPADPQLAKAIAQFRADYGAADLRPAYNLENVQQVALDIENFINTYLANSESDFIAQTNQKAVAPAKKKAKVAAAVPPAEVSPLEISNPVSFVVDRVESDVAQDLLKEISGVGLLMRLEDKPVPAGTPSSPVQWRCQNMAMAKVRLKDKFEPLFTEFGNLPAPLIVPCKINYVNDLRNGIINYDNNPLTSRGPLTSMTSYGLQSQDTLKDTSLIKFEYSASDRAKLTPLTFGKSYQAVPFIVTNNGAIPKDLVDDNSHFNIKEPKDIQPGKDAQVRLFDYRRFVRVGGIRFTGIDSAGKEVAELSFPTVPDNVSPLIRDMAFDEKGVAVTTDRKIDKSAPELPLDVKPQEIPLILLVPKEEPFDNTVVRNNFDFYLRPPSVDIDTWIKWVSGGKIYNRILDTKLIQRAVIGSYYYNLEQNRILAEKNSGGQTNITLDDPAIGSIYIELSRVGTAGNVAATLLSLKSFANPPQEADLTPAALPSLLGKYAQSAPLKVQCAVDTAESILQNSAGYDCRITVKKGGVYKLKISCFLPAEDYPPGTAANPSARFANIYKPLPQITKGYAVSTSEMFIEVATDELWDKNGKKDIEKWVTPRFTSTAGRDILEVRLTENGNPKEFPYIGRVQLQRQMWRWQGRNSRIHPHIRLKDPAIDIDTANLSAEAMKMLADAYPDPGAAALGAAVKNAFGPLPGVIAAEVAQILPGAQSPLELYKNDLMNWEVLEYGTREDFDYSVVAAKFDTKPNGSRTFSYSEILRGEDEAPPEGRKLSAKSDLRALHYRFKAMLYSRYEGVLKEKVGEETVEWVSKFVPCRLSTDPQGEKLPPPKVQYVFPLTESFNPKNAANSAGLLVVLNEPWFRTGGIGEKLGIEVVLSESGVGEEVGTPAVVKHRFYFEIGGDPIISTLPIVAEPDLGSNDPNATNIQIIFDGQLIFGPIGHTFDEDGKDPLFSATSFIIPAPRVIDKNNKSAELPGWGMAEIRFRRIISIAGAANAQTEKRIEGQWTDSRWVQFVPELFVKKGQLIDPKNSTIDYDSSGAKLVIMTDKNRVNLAKSETGHNEFDYVLLLMKEVFDAEGGFGEVAFVCICTLESDGSWRPTDDISRIDKSRLCGEVIQIQKRKSGAAITSKETLWKALFDVNVPDEDRARIVAISPKIGTNNLKEC